jgi:hypothetical protein
MKWQYRTAVRSCREVVFFASMSEYTHTAVVPPYSPKRNITSWWSFPWPATPGFSSKHSILRPKYHPQQYSRHSSPTQRVQLLHSSFNSHCFHAAPEQHSSPAHSNTPSRIEAQNTKTSNHKIIGELTYPARSS